MSRSDADPSDKTTEVAAHVVSYSPLPARAVRVGAGAGPAGRGVCPMPHRRPNGQAVESVFKRPIEVKKVSPATVKGLCEIQVSFQGRPSILYADVTGAYFVTGHLIDAESRAGSHRGDAQRAQQSLCRGHEEGRRARRDDGWHQGTRCSISSLTRCDRTARGPVRSSRSWRTRARSRSRC